MGNLEEIKSLFTQIGIPSQLFKTGGVNLLVDRNRVVVRYPAPGVRSEVEETETGVRTKIYVEPGTKLEKPVTLCFGAISSVEIQTTENEIVVGEGASVKFVVYGAMVENISLKHKNELKIRVKKGAHFEYLDFHHCGERTLVELETKTTAIVEESAYFRSLFKQNRGRTGNARITIEATALKNAVVELETKLIGKEDDKLYVKDVIKLEGENSRGLSKSRIVAMDRTKAEFIGETYGFAPYCRGHIDCSEVVRGEGVEVKAIPIVVVNHPTAKITHEASIGSIDKKQLETLMARGLSEEEAVEVIVKGLLR